MPDVRYEAGVRRWYTAVNCAYYAGNAAVLNFSTLYLQALGYSNTVIGTAFAVAAGLSLLVQSATAAVLDNRPQMTNRRVMLAGNLLLCAASCALTPLHGVPAGFLTVFVLIYASVLAMQQFTSALAMEIRNSGIRINFGMSRGMGSSVFIAVTLLGGRILTAYDAKAFPLICAAVGAASAAVCWRLPFRGDGKAVPAAPGRQGLRAYAAVFRDHPTIVPMLLAVMLVSVFTSCVASFLIVILRNAGGEAASLAWIQSFGTLCEIPLFMLFDRIVYRFSCRKVLLFSTFVYLLRCLMYLLAHNVWWIVGAQALQGLSYSLFYASCVVYINEVTSDENKAKGQALMAMVSMSVGNILASILSGVLLDALGVRFMLAFAFGCLLAGFVIMAVTLLADARRQAVPLRQEKGDGRI